MALRYVRAARFPAPAHRRCAFLGVGTPRASAWHARVGHTDADVDDDDHAGDDDEVAEALLMRMRLTTKKKRLHFSICACHPCAGAMLIFSVSFQF